MSLFSDLFTGQRRRHDERDVRVHPDAGQVPASPKHRPQARNAAAALHQIKAEAPLPPTPMPDPFAFEPFALGWMDDDIDRMRAAAADKESHANQLLGEASRLRSAADTWQRVRRLADVLATQPGPQVPLDDQAPDTPPVAGDLCFGCKRSRDTLPCYSALEGRAVPLCPRCHPSADITDERDHDEPERVDGPWRDSDHPWGATADEPDDSEAERALDAYMAAEPPHDEDLAHADAVWHAQHPGQCCPNFMTCVECSTFQRVPEPAPDLPEALVSEPLGAPSVRSEADAAGWDDAPDTGRAAVPQLQRERDTQTIRLPWGAPAVLDDTRTDLETLNGAEQR